MRSATPLAIAAALALIIPPLLAESIWIEGEAAKEKNVSKHGWYDDVSKDGMSGGEWLSHYDQRRAGTATYEFACAKAGKFTFWWRGNVLLSQVSYRLNGGDFQIISLKEKRANT